jgi:hypothetical protein
MHSCLNSAENTADIVIIQEPWIGTNESPTPFYTISHPPFTLLLSQPENCPRTATFLTKTNLHIHTSLRTDLSNDEDIQILTVSTPSITTSYLYNIYNERPRYDQTLPYTVDQTLKNINIPERSILAGDFNAHHPWWNSFAKRSIGHETLLQITEEGNFDLLNEEDTTSAIFLTTLPERKRYVVFYPVPHLFWVYTLRERFFPHLSLSSGSLGL